MEYQLIMHHGLEQATYEKSSLEECCLHIAQMLRLAHIMDWKLDFEIYSIDHHGNMNFIRWNIACLSCIEKLLTKGDS